MRISDWSSDVCSSDLPPIRTFVDAEPRHSNIAPSRRNPLLPAVHRHAGILRNSRPSEKRGSSARTGHELNITWLSPLCGTTLPRMQKRPIQRSEEHTSELQSLMRISYAVFCLKKKKN